MHSVEIKKNINLEYRRQVKINLHSKLLYIFVISIAYKLSIFQQ